ncbi:MAG: nucleoside hydrolase [Bryobacteraceae bacterium]|nr:nucleoside hydrolase [Bryobacteraceae bacterium]
MTGLAAGAERIVIDTDCGFFGDDGTTLVMLLRRPGLFRVEAITIVSGNVWARQSAGYVREILKLLKRPRLPVYLGAQMPLVRTAAMAAAEKDVEFRGAFAEKQPDRMPAGVRAENAVSYLIRTIEANPGEITLVGLGPLTNIAMALRLRPEIAGKIRRLVFMGGQYRVAGNASKAAEFNFWFDPEAAQVVLRSAIREKIMFGLDVCNKAMLDKPGFDAIAAAGGPIAARFREDFGVRYPGFLNNSAARVSLWDALVAAWMIEPKLFGSPENLALDVDSRFGPTYGAVIGGGPGSVTMMIDVNYPKVYEMFRSLMVAR